MELRGKPERVEFVERVGVNDSGVTVPAGDNPFAGRAVDDEVIVYEELVASHC